MYNYCNTNLFSWIALSLTSSVLVILVEVVDETWFLVLPVVDKLGHMQVELCLVHLIKK